MDDLWPSNIAETKLVAPVSILKEQAALLGEKTKQLVQGAVTTRPDGSMLVHSFFLVAPTLNYRYELFRATHDIKFYPVNIIYLNSATHHGSEAAFKAKLKEIFSAPHTVTTVQSILATVQP